MIGYLKGTVLFREEGLLVVEAGGIGFEISPTMSAYDRAGEPGDETELVIYTLVREEELSLFGFSTRQERSLFELLMRVTGVGPRLALVIVSQLGEEAFIQAVLTGNPLPFTRIKGIGKRTAERVILDLKDKVSKLYSSGIPSVMGPGVTLSARFLEAQEALVGLGFRRTEAAPALHALREMKEAPLEELIREALKRLKK